MRYSKPGKRTIRVIILGRAVELHWDAHITLDTAVSFYGLETHGPEGSLVVGFWKQMPYRRWQKWSEGRQ